jgi:exoribonuclease R
MLAAAVVASGPVEGGGGWKRSPDPRPPAWEAPLRGTADDSIDSAPILEPTDPERLVSIDEAVCSLPLGTVSQSAAARDRRALRFMGGKVRAGANRSLKGGVSPQLAGSVRHREAYCHASPAPPAIPGVQGAAPNWRGQHMCALIPCSQMLTHFSALIAALGAPRLPGALLVSASSLAVVKVGRGLCRSKRVARLIGQDVSVLPDVRSCAPLVLLAPEAQRALGRSDELDELLLGDATAPHNPWDVPPRDSVDLLATSMWLRLGASLLPPVVLLVSPVKDLRDAHRQGPEAAEGWWTSVLEIGDVVMGSPPPHQASAVDDLSLRTLEMPHTRRRSQSEGDSKFAPPINNSLSSNTSSSSSTSSVDERCGTRLRELLAAFPAECCAWSLSPRDLVRFAAALSLLDKTVDAAVFPSLRSMAERLSDRRDRRGARAARMGTASQPARQARQTRYRAHLSDARAATLLAEGAALAGRLVVFGPWHRREGTSSSQWESDEETDTEDEDAIARRTPSSNVFLRVDTSSAAARARVLASLSRVHGRRLELAARPLESVFQAVPGTKTGPADSWLDVPVPLERWRNRALHGDEVVCVLQSARELVSARVVHIAQRRTTSLVATVLSPHKRQDDASSSSSDDDDDEQHQDESQQRSAVLAIPMDRRFPAIRLQGRPGKLAGNRLVVALVDWPAHASRPVGDAVRVLGRAGTVEAEVRSVLFQTGTEAHARKFTPAQNRCAPALAPNGSWTLPDAHGEGSPLSGPAPFASLYSSVPHCVARKGTRWRSDGRLDLRSALPVASVDPPGCKDIDDALTLTLSRTREGASCLVVGVHIADVSHFVSQGSPLDREAQDRCTTVYLPDRRMDMLPGSLCEVTCSLRARVARFALTMLWGLGVRGWSWGGREPPRDLSARATEAVLMCEGGELPLEDASGFVQGLWEAMQHPSAGPEFEALPGAFWVGPTVVRSSHALTYAQAMRIASGKEAGGPGGPDSTAPHESPRGEPWWRLDTTAPPLSDGLGLVPGLVYNDEAAGGECGWAVHPDEQGQLRPFLVWMVAVARWLRRLRGEGGAIEFESTELRFNLSKRVKKHQRFYDESDSESEDADPEKHLEESSSSDSDSDMSDTDMSETVSAVTGDRTLGSAAQSDTVTSVERPPRLLRKSSAPLEEAIEGIVQMASSSTPHPDETLPPPSESAVVSNPKHSLALESADDGAHEMHSAIAELMVLANNAAARLTVSASPRGALLRRHRPARAQRFSELLQAAALAGVHIDTTSNRSLAESISSLAHGQTAVAVSDSTRRWLSGLATRAMEEAEYISSGTADDEARAASDVFPLDPFSHVLAEAARPLQASAPVADIYNSGVRSAFVHYGLGLSFYTHFTSPIRRYADIVVHRLIRQAIGALSEGKTAEAVIVDHRTSLPPRRVSDSSGSMSADLDALLLGEHRDSRASSDGDLDDLFLGSPSRPPASPTRQPVAPSLVGDRSLDEICKRANQQNRAAKIASRECAEVFLALWLRYRCVVVDSVVEALEVSAPAASVSSGSFSVDEVPDVRLKLWCPRFDVSAWSPVVSTARDGGKMLVAPPGSVALERDLEHQLGPTEYSLLRRASPADQETSAVANARLRILDKSGSLAVPLRPTPSTRVRIDVDGEGHPVGVTLSNAHHEWRSHVSASIKCLAWCDYSHAQLRPPRIQLTPVEGRVLSLLERLGDAGDPRKHIGVARSLLAGSLSERLFEPTKLPPPPVPPTVKSTTDPPKPGAFVGLVIDHDDMAEVCGSPANKHPRATVEIVGGSRRRFGGYTPVPHSKRTRPWAVGIAPRETKQHHHGPADRSHIVWDSVPVDTDASTASASSVLKSKAAMGELQYDAEARIRRLATDKRETRIKAAKRRATGR